MSFRSRFATPTASIAAGLFIVAGPAFAQTTSARADAVIDRITRSAPFRKAAAALDAGHDRWVQDVITLTEIPAPFFQEAARATALRTMFEARGLTDVEIDAEGNVLGLRKGADGGKLVIVSAHLDTVFPEGTDVRVRREGDKLHAPGVGDDSAGLATMLALLDAMNAAGIRTDSDILFVGTVGEEGLGEVRGARYLFTKGKYKDRAKAFFTIDFGTLNMFVRGGAGSRRYRVTYRGPGGHSYGSFGQVNPLAALSQAIVDFYKVEVPADPKTTYSASVVGGGTSINSIPAEVWLEVDMRSESREALARLEASFLAVLDRAAKTENAARSTRDGAITYEAKLVGDRPPGVTPETADIVQFTAAAYRREGIVHGYYFSGSDANIPISLGIPAINISRAATGGRAHSPDEWMGIEKADNVKLKRINLAAILSVAGMR